MRMEKKIKLLIVVGIVAVLCVFGLLLLTEQEPPHYKAPEGYPQVVEAKDVPSSESLKEWKNFTAKYGDFPYVKWDKYSDSPRIISGRFTRITNISVSNAIVAEEVAMNFIKDNKRLLNVRIQDLKLGDVTESTDNREWGVEYTQIYHKIPVYQGFVKLSITKDGKMDTVTNRFYSSINIVTTPKITKDEAVEIAKKEVGIKESLLDKITSIVKSILGFEPIEHASLIVLPKAKEDTLEHYLTWKVCCPLDQVVFVDAISGEIILTYSQLVSEGEST